jgi:membrane-bound lytic murein transglycosylase D
MKARAILLASMLLAGCHSTQYDGKSFQNKNQQLSSPSELDASNAYSSLDWLISSDGQYQDLWTYVSNGMSINVPQNSRVKEERTRYTKRKDYLPKVATRAEPYMYWIVEQIKQRNMPIELALLPIVESEFNPHAVSSAKAAGIWQIVPTTGLYYGLKQDEWYDGRQDVMASTQAALDLLQRLNTMFDGDWLLTIAAYNSGEGRVLNAIKENKAKGKKTDFWSLSLPPETAAYVPRLLALADVVKHQKKYDIALPKGNPKRALDQLEVGQQIELTQVAKMTGLPLSKVISFNAGYKHQVTPPNGPHKITLPKSHSAVLQQALAHQKATLVTEASYTVRDGDNLDKIAKRFNSHKKAIVNLNQLDSDALTVGEVIAVPMYSADVTESLLENKIAEEKRKTSVRKLRYKIASGDSLSVVAKKLGVKTADLQKWNKLKNNRIKPGQSLVYYIDFKNAKKITYSVQSGDTMTSVAQKYGLDINDVLSWNRALPDIHRLQSGDQLTLYVAN